MIQLLVDILRYGTIIEVSKLKGVSYNKVSKQLEQVLARLAAKLDWLKENGPEIMLGRAKAMMQAEACQQTIKRQELDLIEAKANIHYLKTQLTQAQNKLERRDELKAKRMEQIASLKKELLNADKTIIDLRYTNRKLQSELESYKAKETNYMRFKKMDDSIKKFLEEPTKSHPLQNNNRDKSL